MKGDINLGRKLTEAYSDKAKIALRTGVRVAFFLIFVISGVWGRPLTAPVNFISGFIVFLILLLVLLFVFWPLIHLKDYVEFYEAGICYCGRKWTSEELGSITFREVKSNQSFFSDVMMDTDIKAFLITYIKEGKKQFNRAYHDIYQP